MLRTLSCRWPRSGPSDRPSTFDQAHDCLSARRGPGNWCEEVGQSVMVMFDCLDLGVFPVASFLGPSLAALVQVRRPRRFRIDGEQRQEPLELAAVARRTGRCFLSANEPLEALAA